MYDGTEESKIFDKTTDKDTLATLLVLSLVSVKYDSVKDDFVPCITHDGTEYETRDSRLQYVIDEVSVGKNNSTKDADEEGNGTYNVKVENVKIKATFTYTDGTTTWKETLETDFTIDAVVTVTEIDEDVYIEITSTMTVNGTEYPVLKYNTSTSIYEYKGYKGTVDIFK